MKQQRFKFKRKPRFLFKCSNTPFTCSKNYMDCNLDCNPEVVPVNHNTGHTLFNTTKRITLLIIVQSLLHPNPANIWIKIIQIEIQIRCLHRTKFLYTDQDLHHDPDNSAPCKPGIILIFDIQEIRSIKKQNQFLHERGRCCILFYSNHCSAIIDNAYFIFTIKNLAKKKSKKINTCTCTTSNI